MPYSPNHATLCPHCPFGYCVEDRRVNRVRNRNTEFRLRQNVAMGCTFEQFVPGTDNDPNPARTFDEYLGHFRANAQAAGAVLFPGVFRMEGSAMAKVEGDVFGLLEAAALWNAAAVWNDFMQTGAWKSNVFTQPNGAVATPLRKVAILPLPRGYDTTKLFNDAVRANIRAFESSLNLRSMSLGLSSPDIVGVRIPDPMPPGFAPFLKQLPDLSTPNREQIEQAYSGIEGTLDGHEFLFAISVKRTIRSDRLYQPLFEANVLKYIIAVVLRGAAFKFSVHLGSLEGADVIGAYKAASLVSLMRGGQPDRAVDHLFHAVNPAATAQTILNDLPLFP